MFTTVLGEHIDFSFRAENERWRQHVTLTCTGQYSVTSEKTAIIVTDIRNPNLNITTYFMWSQNTFSEVKIL
jgi:hypothetical protein